MTSTTTQQVDLSILFSCRIRLNEGERQLLKKSYQLAKDREVTEQPAVNKGTNIRVVSATLSGGKLDHELGMSHLVMTDLVNSRESIHIPLLLKIQKVLGVEIVTKKRLMDSAKNYITFIMSQAEL